MLVSLNLFKASATDEAIALLLFEWAVSKYRVGKYRALAVATLLQRRQAEILEEVRPQSFTCLLYTSPSPRDGLLSRMPSSA